MAVARIGEARVERPLGHLARRLSRQDLVEWRSPDAGLARIVWPGRHHDGAAVAHVLGDVVEIDDRQHALAGVAVEDYHLELLDLLLKQPPPPQFHHPTP